MTRQAPSQPSASQPEAGAWLDIFPDGTASTRIESAPFEVGLERRGGLRITLAADAFDELAMQPGAILAIRDGAHGSYLYSRPAPHV